MPVVTVEATTGHATEGSELVFTFHRTGDLSNIQQLDFGYSGSATNEVDFTRVSGAEFAAGSDTAELRLATFTDGLTEGPESVGVNLAQNYGYTVGTPGTATATLYDPPVVTVEATTGHATEGSELVFTFHRTGDLSNIQQLDFGYSGSATNEVDFTRVSGAEFAAGSDTAELRLATFTDGLTEGPESVGVNLAQNYGYTVGTPGTATATLYDPPVVTVEATTGHATEGSELVFTFHRTGDLSNVQQLDFGYSGSATNEVDFTRVSGAEFAAGSDTAELRLATFADGMTEGPESVGVNLAQNYGYTVGTPGTATATLYDPPVVTVEATTGHATEGSELVFTFHRTGDLSNIQQLDFGYSGSATNEVDFTRVSGAEFAAGSDTAELRLATFTDGLTEGPESVGVNLAQNYGYTVGTPGTATATLYDPPVVTVEATTGHATEGSELVFTFHRTGDLSNVQQLDFGYSGSATNEVDFTRVSGAEFAAGSDTAELRLATFADGMTEGPESVGVNLAQNYGYTVGTPGTATATLYDPLAIISNGGGDTATVSVSENSTAVTTVSATTPGAGGSLSYSIAGGDDAARFTINGANGQLAFVVAPDYEAAADVGTNDIYDVIVQVSDGLGGTDTQAIAVTVQNVGGATINGTSQGQTHTGTGEEDTIFGLGGADTLQGLAGNDYLDGGIGADTMVGGTGNDTYVVERGADVVTESANQGTDTVLASITYTLGTNVENLTLTGTGNINGTGNAASNTIIGNAGNNDLAGLAGADVLNGGQGTDTATYAASAAGVNVSLATGTGSGGDAQGDTLANIENLTGSTSVDTLEGNGGNNVLSGGGGNDTVSYEHAAAGVTVSLAISSAQNTGGAGTDTLSSFNNLMGSGSNDVLTGTSAANTLTGLGGNDTLNGVGGADTLSGGAGNDTLNGGAGADTLNGGADADALNGDDGADTLNGGDGADILNGGAAADTLTGGLGPDRFIFTATSDSTPSNRDIVTDFQHGTDVFDFSGIDARTGGGVNSGDQAFGFGGHNAGVVPYSVTWFESGGNTVVQADVNGNASADFVIVLTGINHQLVASDFLL